MKMRADEPVTNKELWEVFGPHVTEAVDPPFDFEAVVFWMEWT